MKKFFGFVLKYICKKRLGIFLLIFCVLMAILVYAPKIDIVSLFDSWQIKTQKTDKEEIPEFEEKNDVLNDVFFELSDVFTELNVSGYDKMSNYTNQDNYVLDGNALVKSVDLENYKFISADKQNEIYVDIKDFMKKCIRMKEMYASYIGGATFRKELEDYYMIPLDETSTFCIQHVYFCYEEGTKDGKTYFEWKSIDITGVLLEKSDGSESEENVSEE